MSSFDPKDASTSDRTGVQIAGSGSDVESDQPDLTANVDRESLEMMGGPVPERALSRHDGQTSFSTLTTIGESPIDAKLLYTGQRRWAACSVTRDGGQTWTNGERSSCRACRRHTDVSSVAAVAPCRGPRLRDVRRPLQRRLPRLRVRQRRLRPDVAIDRVRACRRRRCTSCASTRGIRGCCFSATSAASTSRSTAAPAGRPLNLNMPNVPVDDILIHPRENDLIVGTHGRSIWVLDQHLVARGVDARTRCGAKRSSCAPARARLLSIYNPQAWYAALVSIFAPNPDFNAADRLLPARGSKDEVIVTVADGRGTPIRARSGHQPRRPESGLVGSASRAAGPENHARDAGGRRFRRTAAGSARAARRVRRHRQRRRANAQRRAACRGRPARDLLRCRPAHAANRPAESVCPAEIARVRRAWLERPPSGQLDTPGGRGDHFEPRRRVEPA